MSPMNNASEQRIMVYCDFSESMNDAIVHGLKVCQIFNKELCLFHPYEKGDREAKLGAQRGLGIIIRKLNEDFPSLTISSLTLKGDLSDTITRIAEEYDGIMLVLSNENIKPKVKALQLSQIPFLFVSGNQPQSLRYDNVLLPLDFRKVMKDTSLWASYFGRFNQSTIQVLAANDKNNSNAVLVQKNQKFTEQLLFKLQVDVSFLKANKNSYSLHSEALERSQKDEHNLIIIPASQQVNLIDLMIGLPETKLLKKAGSVPIMFINPKRDMYILCD